MVFIGILVPIIIMGLVGIYIHNFIRRILELIIKDNNIKYKRKINFILTLVIMVPAFYLFGIWSLVILHVFFISILIDCLYFVVNRILRKKNRIFEKIYKSGVISFTVVTLLLGYGYMNMQNVIETNYNIYTDKNIRDDGYKIAFISDLHYGLNMNGQKLNEYCNEIEKKKPDMVILGGDIVDESTTLVEMQEAFNILSQIKSTYGTFYVYGNHDKSIYSLKHNYSVEQLDEAINNSGITILADNSFNINDEITITGRKDRTFDGVSVRKSAQELADDTNIDENKYNILADHQPREFEELSNAGYDIMLSGHTHGGQIWPGGLFIKTFMKDTLNYGHTKNNNMDIIVSSGIAGWGYPIRTEKHCEYVVVNIVKDDI